MIHFKEPRIEKTAQLESYIVQFFPFLNLIFHGSKRLLRLYNKLFGGPGRPKADRFSRCVATRPAKSPDLGRRLPAFSLHCRLSGFDIYFTGEIENLLAFFFQIEYFSIYGNQISIRDCRS